MLGATALAVLGCTPPPTTAQVTGPLALDVPELCTKCLEVLRCESGDRETIYVLHEKSFGAQIATIWTYLVWLVRVKTEDFRDASILVRERVAGEWGPVSRTDDLRARLDIWNRRIELPGAVISLRDASWTDAAGAPLGRCTQLRNLDASRFLKELP